MTDSLAVETLTPGLLDQFGDILDVGVLAVDADLVVRGWNHWMEEMSGRRAADIIGQPLLALFPELSGSPAESAFRTALTGATVLFSHSFHRYLIPLQPPGSGEFEFMQQTARLLPTHGVDDRPSGVLVVIRDVTERVAREDALRDAMQRSQLANRAKSEFLASMSHELRTPLAAIIGYVDVLAHEMVGSLNPVQKAHLDRVRGCAKHLMAIIEEILTFSKLEADKETLHLDEVDVTELVRQAAAVVQPQATSKGLKLEVLVPGAPLTIRSDGTKIRQVLINLLGNAVKFTDQGSVRVRLEGASDFVTFQVQDSGPGIEPANLDRIFEPFTQVDQSNTRPKGGTGLGLPVSRKLAGLLGGELLVDSAFGAGSTFTLRLPLDVASVSPAPDQAVAAL